MCLKNKDRYFFIGVIVGVYFLLSGFASSVFAQTNNENLTKGQGSDIWVSAYLVSWNHFAPPGGNWGHLQASEINWDAFTHLIYFALTPNKDGTLSKVEPYENINPDRLNSIIKAAHKHQKPVLLTIGGYGLHDKFVGAFSDKSRSIFIDNLISTMNRWGFDGIDLDLEPIRESDKKDYITFVNKLYEALQKETTPLLDRPLLTAATNWKPEMFAKLYEKFDQINLMTYDMSGAWQGWVTWHNSPLYNGGDTFSNGNPLPSVDRKVQEFLEVGIPPQKIGIGIDFYGYVWHGVNSPREGWQDQTPKVERAGGVPYYELANRYNLSNAKWDKSAKVPYLSIDSPKQFVSFDNARSIKEKIEYVKNNNLGGAILWDVSASYKKDNHSGKKNVLLQAVKRELYQ